jgi:hypothetical protein
MRQAAKPKKGKRKKRTTGGESPTDLYDLVVREREARKQQLEKHRNEKETKAPARDESEYLMLEGSARGYMKMDSLKYITQCCRPTGGSNTVASLLPWKFHDLGFQSLIPLARVKEWSMGLKRVERETEILFGDTQGNYGAYFTVGLEAWTRKKRVFASFSRQHSRSEGEVASTREFAIIFEL